MEALRVADARLTVYVHPSNAADVRRAVNRQLSSLLFSYEDRFDGVLLAHESEVEGQKAKILNGLVPYFGVQVHATLLLFSPQPDMILEGKVEVLGKESIHAIIFGVFSAAIMSEDISEKFRFKSYSLGVLTFGKIRANVFPTAERMGRDGGRFVSRADRKHVIRRGTVIRFSVKRVDTEMNCHITGSLIPPHTGCMRWLSEHDAEYASELQRAGDKKRLRDLNIKIEHNEQEQRMLNNEGSVMNSERPRKSRKKSVEQQ
ncbi:hypothetical protein ACP4OV_028134 [Aristida adscensionis]